LARESFDPEAKEILEFRKISTHSHSELRKPL